MSADISSRASKIVSDLRDLLSNAAAESLNDPEDPLGELRAIMTPASPAGEATLTEHLERTFPNYSAIARDACDDLPFDVFGEENTQLIIAYACYRESQATIQGQEPSPLAVRSLGELIDSTRTGRLILDDSAEDDESISTDSRSDGSTSEVSTSSKEINRVEEWLRDQSGSPALPANVPASGEEEAA